MYSTILAIIYSIIAAYATTVLVFVFYLFKKKDGRDDLQDKEIKAIKDSYVKKEDIKPYFIEPLSLQITEIKTILNSIVEIKVKN